MTQYLLRFLYKTFDLRPGEIRRALLLQFNIFLVITVILMLKSVVNALFLAELGVKQLPIAFILVAVFAGFLSYLYSFSLDRKSLITVISNTYIVSMLSLIAFAVLLKLNLFDRSVLYFFFIFVSLFAVLAASQFWVLVNVVFNLREAKRLFGFIGAGAISGGIFGGYLTSALAAGLGAENIIFIAVVFLGACLPISIYVWKKFVTEKPSPSIAKKKTKILENKPLKLLLNSRQLKLIAAVVGISVIVAKLVDYQFSAYATRTFEDPDELAAFFGFWFSTTNVVSLIIQLFLTRRVVGMYGVGMSLFILPVALLFPAIGLLFLPKLWLSVLLKVNEGSLKQSINKAGVELLMLPVPYDIKKQTKTFIDVFIDSLATGIGGLLLLIITVIFKLPLLFTNFIILVLIGAWMYIARKVRLEYINLFKSKVFKGQGKKEQIDLNSTSVIGGIVNVLQRGEDKQVLYMLKKLKEFEHPSFEQPLVQLLDHQNDEIVVEALRRLYYYKNSVALEKARALITSPNDLITVAAFEYLMEHDPEDFEHLALQFLNDENLRRRMLALVSITFEFKDNPEMMATIQLEQRVAEMINDVEKLEGELKIFTQIQLLKAIGIGRMQAQYGWLTKKLNEENPVLLAAALEGAGYTGDPQFIPTLLKHITTPGLDQVAITGLSNYGQYLTTHFYTYFNESMIEHAGEGLTSVLEKIVSVQSVDLLISIAVKGSINTRLHALKALNRMKTEYPSLVFNKKKVIHLIFDEAKGYHTILSVLYIQNERLGKSKPEVADARNSLIEILERRLNGNIERIFYLLGLRYSPNDMLPAYENLKSKHPDHQTNAIEFLENILDTGLKKVVLPLVEASLEEKVSKEIIENLNIKIASQYECFENLLKGKDLKLKLAVLHLIDVMNDPKYHVLAKPFVDDPNIKLRTFARRVLDLTS